MYVVVDHMMNGTVTMHTDTHLIDVETFEEAVQFIKDRAAAQGLKLINEHMSPDGWSYGVEQPPAPPGSISLGCWGNIPREPIGVLK